METLTQNEVVAPVDSAQSAINQIASQRMPEPTVEELKRWLLARQNEALRGMYNSTGEAFGKHCDDFIQLTTAYQVLDRFMALSRG